MSKNDFNIKQQMRWSPSRFDLHQLRHSCVRSSKRFGMLGPEHIEESRTKLEPTKHWPIPKCQLWKRSGRNSSAGSAGFCVRPAVIGLSTSQAKEAAAEPMVWIHTAVSLVSLHGTPSVPAKQKWHRPALGTVLASAFLAARLKCLVRHPASISHGQSPLVTKQHSRRQTFSPW